MDWFRTAEVCGYELPAQLMRQSLGQLPAERGSGFLGSRSVKTPPSLLPMPAACILGCIVSANREYATIAFSAMTLESGAREIRP